MPPSIVRPCSASATAVSKSRSILSAGRISTRTSAGRSPWLAKSCGARGGTTTTSPGPATMRSRRSRKRIVPSTTSNRSSWSGWRWRAGDASSRGELEVDRHELAVRLRRGCAEGDSLAAGGFTSVCPGTAMSASWPNCCPSSLPPIVRTVYGREAMIHDCPSNSLDYWDTRRAYCSDGCVGSLGPGRPVGRGASFPAYERGFLLPLGAERPLGSDPSADARIHLVPRAHLGRGPARDPERRSGAPSTRRVGPCAPRRRACPAE